MQKPPKKILFAAVDVGYRIELYTKFIRQYHSMELYPESLCTYVLPKEHYKSTYTYEYNFHLHTKLYRWHKSLFNFIRCLCRYDVFHFISGETLLTRKLRRFELRIYKIFGKRIIMHFVGSDIRDEGYIYWKEQNIIQFIKGTDNNTKSLPWQKELIQDAERYADSVLVSTPDLKKLIPNSIYYPVMLDLDKFLLEINERPPMQRTVNEIVILHCPSSVVKSKLKGTDYIIKVLKKMEQDAKYNIRLLLPSEDEKKRSTNYSATRYELFQYYKEADIIIDQMIIGWYGLLSVEALATGKQVISYIDEALKPFLFPNCPIRQADVNTLEKIIVSCIEDIQNGVHKPSDQIDWVRKNHTIEYNHMALLNSWNINENPDEKKF
jgi:hypothetical protein